MSKLPDYSRTEIEQLIREYIVGKNAERDRKIVYRRMIDGVCYEPLADEFDMSVRQVKNIVYKWQDFLLLKREG